MRVLIPTWFGLQVAGGCQSHVKDLQGCLQSVGHAVRLLTADSLPQASMFPRLVMAPLYPVAPEQYRTAVTHWRRRVYRGHIAKALREFHPDVVHAHDVFVGALFSGWHPVPLVLTVHGYAAFEAASVLATAPGRPYFRALQRLELLAYSAASQIITVDSRIRDYIVGLGIPNGKIQVIPNAVNTDRFSPGPLGNEGEGPTVLCPRRLVPKNGPEIALRAVAELRVRHGRKARLIFAGDGPLETQLREEARQREIADSVHFLGAVPHEEMPALYRAAHAVVVPSIPTDGIEEATSISALEGMACGRPVIASAIGGLAEIVDHGHNGWLVPPNDPVSLANVLAEILSGSSTADRIAAEAALSVRKNFGVDQWVARKVRTYEAALGH